MARSVLSDADDAQTGFLHSVVNRLDGIDFREDMMESRDPFSKLSTEITRLVDTVKQGNDLLRRKKEVREILYSTLRAEVPGQIDLYLVGSSLNGLGTKTSDIDLCLVMNNFGPGFCHFRVAVPMLRLVEKIFSNIPFVRNMKLILAKVPLLRFTDAESGLEVDLNFNNIVGIRNTQFIGFYTRMDKRFQPLVVTVKTWARLNNINNARNKTISSYTFVLMVIHYLQYGCDVPVLPCLHKLMPGKFKPDSDITKLNLFEELPKFRSFNRSSVGQLFLGFLHYYGHIFDFERDVVSVRTGGVVPKALACKFESAKNNPRQWNYICVEEPFERTNTAKSVYDEEAFKRIRSVFQQSHTKLVKTKSLFAVMNLDRHPTERRPKTDKCSERDYPPRKVRLQGHFQPYFVYSHQNPQCLPLYSNST